MTGKDGDALWMPYTPGTKDIGESEKFKEAYGNYYSE